MKAHVIEQPTRLNRGTVLGLDAAQIQRRAHLLEPAEVKGLPDGYTGQILTGPTQFKRGEVIYADELPKNLATIVVAGAAGKASSSQDEEASEKKPAAKKKTAAKGKAAKAK